MFIPIQIHFRWVTDRLARLFRIKLCRGIARTMQHTQNDQPGWSYAVVDGVISMDANAKAGRQFVAFGAHFRILTKGIKPFANLMDQAGCRVMIVLSDKRPDIGKIVLSRLGN